MPAARTNEQGRDLLVHCVGRDGAVRDRHDVVRAARSEADSPVVDGQPQGSGPGASVSLATGGSAAVRPPRQPLRRRLAYVALDAVNRLVPKAPDRVVLHSTIDLEDGVLAEPLSAIPSVPAADLETLLYADLTARKEAQRIMRRSFC